VYAEKHDELGGSNKEEWVSAWDIISEVSKKVYKVEIED
jgi:hypothetical protein